MRKKTGKKHGVLENYALDLFEDEKIQDDDEKKVEDFFDIEVRSHNLSLLEFKEFWHKNYMDIPDFQRPYIWDKKVASKFIESVLLGLPVPNIFLYRSKKYKNDLVIDGHQRIVTAVSFIEGKFVTGKREGEKFELSEDIGIWNGKSYKSLDEKARNRFDSYVMTATIIKQKKPNDDESMFQIFSRLNTGGKALSPMEVRMCLGYGKFTRLLEELNDLDEWRTLLGKRGKDKLDQRRKDIELILRFFALQEAYDEKSKKTKIKDKKVKGKKSIDDGYYSPMKNYLDDYALRYKKTDSKWRDKKEKLFRETIKKASQIKEKPFHYANPEKDSKERLNLTVFDSIMVALASSKLDGQKLKDTYEKLFRNKEFLKNIQRGEGTMSKENVTKRIRIAKKVFGNAAK